MPKVEPATRRRRQAFTLVEMLVVIGIIIILISLLFPVYMKARLTGYVVTTRQEIANLSNAILRYHSDMPSGSYPGPLSNDQIEQQLSSAIIPGANLDNSNTITMSENLVLGLEGGLYLNGTVITFDPTQVGQGPMNLNPNPSAAFPNKRYPSFVDNLGTLPMTNSVASGYQPGRFMTYGAGPVPANDTDVPEYLDTFPDALPILYYRARTGGAGVISYVAKGEAPTLPNGQKYEYDLGQNTAYTQTNIGLGSPTHGLQDLGSFNSGTIDSNFPNNGGLYFLNQKLVPSNTSSSTEIQITGSPRQVDQFILIAAGRPRYYLNPSTNTGTWVRQYGTEYDICNFGNVMQ